MKFPYIQIVGLEIFSVGKFEFFGNPDSNVVFDSVFAVKRMTDCRRMKKVARLAPCNLPIFSSRRSGHKAGQFHFTFVM